MCLYSLCSSSPMGLAQHINSSKQRRCGWGRGEARPTILPIPHQRYRLQGLLRAQQQHQWPTSLLFFYTNHWTHWLFSSHAQALSLTAPPLPGWPLHTMPSILWGPHVRQATPQPLLAGRSEWRTVRKAVVQGAPNPCVQTSPLSCRKTSFVFSSRAVGHESKHTYLINEGVFCT